MENQNYLEKLLKSEDEQLQKLHDIVKEALNEEELLAHRLEQETKEEKPKFAERLSDKVAYFGGSWLFIISFMLILVAWIVLNSFILLNKSFDPYPYILLNLILSCTAAFQAPVIMMSQNRQETKDRKRAENDYLINLKSEIEIRNLHKKMDLSLIDQFKHLCEIQQKQIEILERIEKKLEEREKNLK